MYVVVRLRSEYSLVQLLKAMLPNHVRVDHFLYVSLMSERKAGPLYARCEPLNRLRCHKSLPAGSSNAALLALIKGTLG